MANRVVHGLAVRDESGRGQAVVTAFISVGLHERSSLRSGFPFQIARCRMQRGLRGRAARAGDYVAGPHGVCRGFHPCWPVVQCSELGVEGPSPTAGGLRCDGIGNGLLGFFPLPA